MTSEVIVMNRVAVAMAADSAVTLSGSKILNSANKLYMLAPGYPVGLLIYNRADLVATPWELIIKSYRDYCVADNVRYDSLESYAKDFVRFIEDHADYFTPQDEGAAFFGWMLNGFLGNDVARVFKREFVRGLEAELETSRPEDEVLELKQRIIDRACVPWEDAIDLFEPTKSQVIADSMENGLQRIEFDRAYDEHCASLKLNESTKERLWKVCISWFTKDRWLDSLYSGIVFAGYGDTDLYPKYTQIRIENIINGILKYKIEKNVSAQEEMGIFAFAQDDIVQTLLAGIHPLAIKAMDELFEKLVNDGLNGVSLYVEDPSSQEPIQLQLADIEESTRKMRATFHDSLLEFMHSNYTMDIINVVSALPKDELALMAETLIGTTSYMRRVSSDVESVGGPTDIAVISKKDGFIWIKRKHYFDPKFNYHFFQNAQQ